MNSYPYHNRSHSSAGVYRLIDATSLFVTALLRFAARAIFTRTFNAFANFRAPCITGWALRRLRMLNRTTGKAANALKQRISRRGAKPHAGKNLY